MTLEIHLQPGAKRNEVAGFRDGVLYVKVTALPQKDQANRALLELLAQTLGYPRVPLLLFEAIPIETRLWLYRA